MKKAVLVLATAFALALTAQAQGTKITGKVHCAKADQANQADVGDKQGHMMMLSKGPCTWTTPMEIAGLKTKDAVDTATSDMNAGRSMDNGYDVTTMDNGDKFFVRYSGSGMMKQDQTGSFSGKWSFTNGTGKLKGIKGSGTYKGTVGADGSSEVDVEGEYTIAETPAKAPAKKSS